MSSHEPPYDPSRPSSDPDATRIQRPANPPGEDRTAALGGSDDTRALDPVPTAPPGRPPLEATVDHQLRGPSDAPYGTDRRTTDAYGQPAGGPSSIDGPARRRWGKGTLLVLLGALLGFLIAFVVIALGTDPNSTAEGSPAAMERIEELEAEVAERDARIADLEAQLAEAGAEAGEADEAIAQQREALDERAAQLDALANALNEREQNVAEREEAVQQREAAVAEREQAVDDGEPPPDGDGIDLPDIPDEDVEGFIDQVLERIRDLF